MSFSVSCGLAVLDRVLRQGADVRGLKALQIGARSRKSCTYLLPVHPLCVTKREDGPASWNTEEERACCVFQTLNFPAWTVPAHGDLNDSAKAMECHQICHKKLHSPARAREVPVHGSSLMKEHFPSLRVPRCLE